MILSAETLQMLFDLHIPGDKLAALLKAIDADAEAFRAPADIALELRREQDRERQKRLREKKQRDAHVSQREQTLPSHDKDARDAPTRPRVEDNSSRIISLEAAADVAETREQPNDWPKGDAKRHAAELVAEIASPWLDPNKSLDLNTTTTCLAAWKREGASWVHDVVPIVAKLCQRNGRPVKSWKFFNDAIAQSIADSRAALVIPLSSRVRQTGPPSLVDRIAEENAEARRKAMNLMKSNG